MKKNYRRKIKQSHAKNWKRDHCRGSKNYWLKQRSRSRRQRDRMLLAQGLRDDEAWDHIFSLEPVDWYAID